MKIETSIITKPDGEMESAKFVAEIYGPSALVRKVLLALSDHTSAERKAFSKAFFSLSLSS